MRAPRAVRVCVATGGIGSLGRGFRDRGGGHRADGIEIMDKLIVRAVKAQFHAGFPTDAGAVLLVEIAGQPDDMDAGERTIAKIARECGALSSARSSANAAERDALWASRKGAAGSLGRIAPNYYIQDATVPRTRLPQALHRVDEIAPRVRSAGGQRLSRGRRGAAIPC